jgi:hypothetical protein
VTFVLGFVVGVLVCSALWAVFWYLAFREEEFREEDR